MKALVFNIQRMSMHDGPGVRSTIFFKGCNLRCGWCHNPESMTKTPEILVYGERCIGCKECVSICQAGARVEKNGAIYFVEESCIHCGRCGEVCVSGALQTVGRWMEMEVLLKEVRKDKTMYQLSGGGVTCSGGEPMLQPEALSELLAGLREEGIHTAVDTAGNVPFCSFERILPVTDLFLYDIKHWEEEAHLKYTGVSNRRIIENLAKLLKEKEVIVRIPLIKGVNEGCMREIAAFLKDKKKLRLVELLPYHKLGVQKYTSLGRKADPYEAPDQRKLREAAGYFKELGIPVKTAGEA